MRAWFQRAERACAAVLDDVLPNSGDPLGEWTSDQVTAYCHRCGSSAGPGAVTPAGCSECVGRPVAWTRLVRLHAYQPPMSDWIVALKFGGMWNLSRHLGESLAHAMEPGPAGDRVAVCPVPMHWFRRWRRGYNQAALVAQALANARRLPVADVLTRTRYTPPQTAVAPSDRPGNVARSFAVRHVDLRGWKIILVDDVKTTGSTASACARLLTQAGAEQVWLAVAAVADHHRTNPR